MEQRLCRNGSVKLDILKVLFDTYLLLALEAAIVW